MVFFLLYPLRSNKICPYPVSPWHFQTISPPLPQSRPNLMYELSTRMSAKNNINKEENHEIESVTTKYMGEFYDFFSSSYQYNKRKQYFKRTKYDSEPHKLYYFPYLFNSSTYFFECFEKTYFF